MSTTTNRTRKMAYIAILTALSFLLMYLQFPLIPSADFLKIDFSIIPILIALVVFDIKASFLILLLRSVLTLLLNNAGPSTLIGIPMNIMALGVFTLALHLFWKRKPNVTNYVLASFIGTIALTIVMVALNYFYAVPMYAQFAGFDINKIIGLSTYLYAMVIPFNVLEGVIFALAFYLIYLAIKPLLEKF